jgi:hypothetical protein
MFDRGDSGLDCLTEETDPLTSIQGGCLLYQTFKADVSFIKHSSLLSHLSSIQACCLLYQTFKAAISLECLIEETSALNV